MFEPTVVSWRIRKKSRQGIYDPVRGNYCAEKRAKKGNNKKGLDSCLLIFLTKKKSCLQIPKSIFKLFVYFGKTPTRAYQVLDNKFLRVPPWLYHNDI